MTADITFKNRRVALNNLMFDRLISFGMEVAERSARPPEIEFVEHMKQLEKEFWPGRGADIVRDFPSVEQRKFWSRVFFDTAQTVFERRVGNQDNGYWQTEVIHHAFEAGLLFQDAVREDEPLWTADAVGNRRLRDIDSVKQPVELSAEKRDKLIALLDRRPGVLMIDTATVTGRRQLHFDSIDQMLADVDALVAAEKSGRLKRVGNWTLGQTLNHLATWMEFAYTGSPLNPPFFIRWFLRMKRKQFFVGPMSAGINIPGVPGGSLGTEPANLDDAIPRFRRAAERLKKESPAIPHNIFGPLTHEDFQAINLRHAELHLSFLQMSAGI